MQAGYGLVRQACRLGLVLALGLPCAGQAEGPETKRAGDWDYMADFRLRLEQDWDSLNGDGTERDDRLRLRIRLRAGLGYYLGDHWYVRARVRSGSRHSQQSPHITIHDFDGGPDGPYNFNPDQYVVGYQRGGLNAWVGRNELEYLHQNDIFTIDNLTYLGVGARVRRKLDDHSSAFASINYVALPVGMREFSGRALVGQVGYQREFAPGEDVTVALGGFVSNPDPDDPDNDALLTDNGSRAYQSMHLQLRYRTAFLGQPTRLGVDYTHNFADYADAEPGSFTDVHQDHVDGYVLGLRWGSTQDPGHWQLGYDYAYQEALVANSSYTQDEWVRWGNANQVRATNIKGHEFRVTYVPAARMNVRARLFLIDAVDLFNPGDTTKETGNRLRVDWNVSF
ncbi:hypothetical protein F3N42_00325 [Marinihelvus fidelis]|uniref:Porin n=1 Tax=Marinihelvus fidelis TaxID=2613842 RepID=A0A5N0THH0_9GAMM|nr:hypothetical protein [Marinihelvus fidelis]KAA9134031.1 hypothetical protein F3N42_00325 [Marinihelvus fidelis]